MKEYSTLRQNSETGASSSDYLASYPGHSLVESYPNAEMQSVYSTAPAERAIRTLNRVGDSCNHVLITKTMY